MLQVYRDPFSWVKEFETIFDRRNAAIPYDVREDDQGHSISVDLPGVRKEDLKVEIANQTISISGERRGQKIFWQFAIPPTADPGQITACLDDGVLALNIPKSEAAKPRMIEVTSPKLISN